MPYILEKYGHGWYIGTFATIPYIYIYYEGWSIKSLRECLCPYRLLTNYLRVVVLCSGGTIPFSSGCHLQLIHLYESNHVIAKAITWLPRWWRSYSGKWISCTKQQQLILLTIPNHKIIVSIFFGQIIRSWGQKHTISYDNTWNVSMNKIIWNNYPYTSLYISNRILDLSKTLLLSYVVSVLIALANRWNGVITSHLNDVTIVILHIILLYKHISPWPAPSYNLKQCCLIVHQTLRGRFRRNQNTKLLMMKMHLKMASVKWRPFCPGWDELRPSDAYMRE